MKVRIEEKHVLTALSALSAWTVAMEERRPTPYTPEWDVWRDRLRQAEAALEAFQDVLGVTDDEEG